MFQVLYMLQRYVISVSYGCCKSGSGCCLCCNGCTRILQTSVPNVSSVFLDVCCKCFILILRIFSMVFQVFSGGCLRVFQAHVFKCFICL
jgi:hypothetical protein